MSTHPSNTNLTHQHPTSTPEPAGQQPPGSAKPPETSLGHPRPQSTSGDTLTVTAWADPVVEALGHDPRSHYVERFWLGVLGPSTTWLLRRLADRFDHAPDGFELPLDDTARELGLGMRNGRHSPFMRSIERACQFGLARRSLPATLEVRRSLPPITQGQLRRLPNQVQRAHQAWRRSQLEAHDERTEQHARRLALTLLEIGEPIDAAERQLCAWRVDASVAARASSWAQARHTAAKAAATDTEDAGVA